MEPLHPFDALTRELARHCPETPAYGGAFLWLASPKRVGGLPNNRYSPRRRRIRKREMAVFVLYALTPGGYAGCSVTIEVTYAYARGKRIITSEAPAEFALRAMVSEVCAAGDLLTRL